MKKHLWLFDIDGVLVNIDRLHTIAYRKDYSDVLGIDVSEELILSTFGLPEEALHENILKNIHIPYDQETIKKLLKARRNSFLEVLKAKEVKKLDGVTEFLSTLKNTGQVIGIVTGNTKHIAKLILEQAGILSFFQIIWTSKGNMQRWQIVQAAIDEAKQKGYSFDKTIVLGDTPHDIEAGKKVGAITVAVATGHVDIETLKAAQPNITLKSLKEYKEIQKYLKAP